MIGSLNSIQATAEKLSIPQLQQAMRDGTLPPYVGVPLLQKKVQMQKQMQMASQLQQPKKPSIAEQVNQEASADEMMRQRARMMQAEMGQTGGISDFLPKGEESYAKGGPIAFAEKGYVDPRYTNLDPFASYDESYFLSNTPAYEELKRRQGMKGVIEKAGRNLYEGAAGTAKYIGEAPKGVYELLKDPVSKFWYGEEVGITPKVIDVETPQITQVTPQTVVLQKQPEATQTQPAIENILNKNAPNRQATDVDQAQALQNRIAARKAPVAGSVASVVQTPYAQAIPAAPSQPAVEPQTTAEPIMSAAERAKQFKEALGEDVGRADTMKRLAEREAATAKQEERAPWLGLMQAGLATMAGTSPFAMTNIGAGGVAGLNAYMKAQDKLDTAKENHDAILAQLNKAQRAEDVAAYKFGADSEQVDKALAAREKLLDKELKARAELNQADIVSREKIANIQANAGIERAGLIHSGAGGVDSGVKADRLQTTQLKAYLGAITTKMTKMEQAAKANGELDLLKSNPNYIGLLKELETVSNTLRAKAIPNASPAVSGATQTEAVKPYDYSAADKLVGLGG
jgi:hypothetical protein